MRGISQSTHRRQHTGSHVTRGTCHCGKFVQSIRVFIFAVYLLGETKIKKLDIITNIKTNIFCIVYLVGKYDIRTRNDDDERQRYRYDVPGLRSRYKMFRLCKYKMAADRSNPATSLSSKSAFFFFPLRSKSLPEKLPLMRFCNFSHFVMRLSKVSYSLSMTIW